MNFINRRSAISIIKNSLFIATLTLGVGCGSDNTHKPLEGITLVSKESGGLEPQGLIVTQREMSFYVEGTIENVSFPGSYINGEIIITVLSKEGKVIAETSDCFRFKSVRFGPKLNQKRSSKKIRFQTQLPFLPSTEETIVVTPNLQNQSCDKN